MGKIILVGSKPLSKDYSKVIDSYYQIIRFNFGIPSGHNGTRTTGIALNCHVKVISRRTQEQFINAYKRNTNVGYLKKVHTYLNKNWKYVSNITIQDHKKINQILKKLGIKGRLSKEGRVGFGSIVYFVKLLWLDKLSIGTLKANTPIDIIGFQLGDTQILSYYRNKISKCNTKGHNAEEEYAILHELMKKGYVRCIED